MDISGVPTEIETRRPANKRFNQQTLPSISTLLTPWQIMGAYTVIALFFVPLGAVLQGISNDIVEYSYQYDGDGAVSEDCKITTYKAGTECEFSINVEKDMAAPVFVYYEIDNYLQNHQTYVDSKYQDQLQGSTSTSSLSSCAPLEKNGSLVLNPCGLIANTLFNDIISITSNQTMDETGIAWGSDVTGKFSQPDGFVSTVCPSGTCLSCLEGAYGDNGNYSTCGVHDDENGDTYAYWYPKDDETQYLHETFPEVISPLDGVKDEHFIVWMRVAGMPRFRKLYGRIDEDITAGETVTFSVTANWLVEPFNGQKHVVLSTTANIGGASPYWGSSFVSLGIIAIVFAALLMAKQVFDPRVMGDIRQLLD